MISLENNSLTIRFPEVHPGAVCTIDFQRTLRIPDDNRTHALPPSLGKFPLKHVDDHAAKLPTAWQKRGGIFLPMHQTEAMWIRFSSIYPFAVKIAAGKINAVTGKPWTTELTGNEGLGWSSNQDEQDYLAVPKQPWLDGFCVEKGKIRQFVAMPLGEGYTVEEQITGEAIHGGLQIIVYPLKPEFYQQRIPSNLRGMAGGASGGLEMYSKSLAMSNSRGLTASVASSAAADMGMAPGGLMEQKIHRDTLGINKYDQSSSAKCFVHLLNSQQYESVTGQKPPHAAPSADLHTNQGLPWFKEWDNGSIALPGAAPLKKLDSVANMANKLGQSVLPETGPIAAKPIVFVVKNPNQVREGDF